MPVCLLCPSSLETLDDIPDDCDETLDVIDRRDDYSTEDGDGVWIGTFLEFCEKIVQARCHLPDFNFSDYDRIDQRLMDEIPDAYTRALLIRFANKNYEDYRDDDISLPDYSDTRSDARNFCDGCESGWTEIHGEYDGPLASDVEKDENENEDGISKEEQAARRERNAERDEERECRQRAQDEAEEEVVDSELTCEDDCDAYVEHVDNCFRDKIDTNIDALKERWKNFLAEIGESKMPELRPESFVSCSI